MKIRKITQRDQDGHRDCKARLYFFHNETVFENLANRRSRPYNEYRKFIPEILKKVGLPMDTKARWSQKAGCSCGCSPGFKLDVGGKDIFVDLA